MMPSSRPPSTTSDTNPVRTVLLMGVSGCGKTSVGEALARRLGGRFIDADHLHPPENKAKMSAKIPLTDDDRRPWLDRLRQSVIDAAPAGTLTVLACSALKRDYRRRLMEGAPGVRLIYLQGPHALIAARLEARRGHFMPPGLLHSQFAILEEPDPREGATVSIDAPVEGIVDACLRALAPA